MNIDRAAVACFALIAGLALPARAADAPAKAQAQAPSSTMTQTPPAQPSTSKPSTPATAPQAPAQPSAGGSAAQMPPGHGGTSSKASAPAKPEKMVDLNNGSKAELMTLPSVGEAEAAKIIANRPYISKVDLVSKAGLPEGLYLAVRHKVVVNDMKKPAPKQPATQK